MAVLALEMCQPLSVIRDWDLEDFDALIEAYSERLNGPKRVQDMDALDRLLIQEAKRAAESGNAPNN